MKLSWINTSKVPDTFLLIEGILLLGIIVLATLLYKWVRQKAASEIQKVMVVSLLPLFSMVTIYFYPASWLSILLQLAVLITVARLHKLWFK